MIIIIILILLILLTYFLTRKTKQIDKKFYTVEETFPKLNKIYDNLDIYKKEVNMLIDKYWIEWVERYLWDFNDANWKIIPFFAFGIYNKKLCSKCPKLVKFLKSIPGIKLAILSKTTSGTVLKDHRGWGNHSNNVLRCHFGFKIPKNCYVNVGEFHESQREIKYHEQDKWLIFDDSKWHFSGNNSNEERIVLIVDIERPKHIKKGTSQVEDTKELLDIINYFKEK
jgi:aspartyl/asparaginyl beta-hydroxylase (cupin superfamily)